MCRTGGRRCPSHSDPVAIQLRNQRRREAYASTRANNNNNNNNNNNIGSPLAGGAGAGMSFVGENVLTEQQHQFFNKTVVKNGDNLIPLYHGATTQFDSFDPSRLGQGNDAWGNGFYFTDHEHVAKGYASESQSPEANVKEFYLNLENPLLVDGKEHMSLNETYFNLTQASNILKNHPDIHVSPTDEERVNPLGDYLPEFWDKDHHSPEEINRMVDKVAKQYFSDVSWPELEGVFGKEHGSAFLEAVHKETGWDGVIVDFGEDGKHYVAWFPTQMKLTSNINPTIDTDKFAG